MFCSGVSAQAFAIIIAMLNSTIIILTMIIVVFLLFIYVPPNIRNEDTCSFHLSGSEDDRGCTGGGGGYRLP